MKNDRLPRDTCDTRDRRRASVTSVTTVTGQSGFMPKATKPLVIRRGQRVPYYKGSLHEIDARRGYIVGMMVRGVPKMSIHGVVKAVFNRQWRTVDRDIALVTEASKWRERARTGYGRISLYETLVKMKLIKDETTK